MQGMPVQEPSGAGRLRERLWESQVEPAEIHDQALDDF